MIRDKINQRIVAISFIAVWGVVVWHSQCGSKMARYIIPTVSYWTIPWFFLVSGFFFPKSFARRNFLEFIKSKFISLVIPYFLWCTIGLMIAVASTAHINLATIVDVYSLGSHAHPAFNGPLWYIRELIIMSVVGGCCFSVARFYRQRFWIVLCMMMFVFLSVLLPLGSSRSVFYFVSGMVVCKIVDCLDATGRIFAPKRRTNMLLASVVGFVLVVSRSAWYAYGGAWIDNVCGILMIVLILLVADICRLERIVCGKWHSVFKLGVFVYLAHMPILMYWVVPALNRANVGRDLSFFLLSIFHVPLCLAVGYIIKKLIPSVYKMLTGGRM